MALLEEKEVLSTQWRINKSSIPVLELANALRALAKVVGTVETQTKSVTFNSEGGGGNKSFNAASLGMIKIDPRFALKETPISPEHMDILVGLAAHEAGHTLVHSEDIITTRVSKIGEEIYCDAQVGRVYPVLGRYIRKARVAYNVPKEDVNWADPIAVWTAVSIYGHSPSVTLPIWVMRLLPKLLEASIQLTTKELPTWARAKIYSDLDVALTEAEKLRDIQSKLSGGREQESYEVRKQEADNKTESYEDYNRNSGSNGGSGEDTDGEDTDNKDKDSEGSEEDKDSKEDPNEDGNEGSDPSESSDPNTDPMSKALATSRAQSQSQLQSQSNAKVPHKRGGDLLPMHTEKEGMNPELLEEVMESIEMEVEDLTSEIASLLETAHLQGALNSVIWTKRPNTEPAKGLDESLYRQLLWAQSLKNSVGRQSLRGQEYGKVDSNRLYRAAIDGLVFKASRKLPLKEVKLLVLLDASSSMDTLAKESVYKASQALHKVFPKIEVVSYSGDNNLTLTTVAGPTFAHRVIRPYGGTPSGGALLTMARHLKDGLILHFTDGEANANIPIETAMRMIEDEFPKIKVLDVRLREYSNGYSPGYVGRGDHNLPKNIKVVYIQRVEEFPEAMKTALKPWFASA